MTRQEKCWPVAFLVGWVICRRARLAFDRWRTNLMAVRRRTALWQMKTGIGVLAVSVGLGSAACNADEKKVPVRFSSGHQIGTKDFGRPIVLIAAALGVKPEVFREAFSGVTPAQGRGPMRDEVRKNKAALLKVLEQHGREQRASRRVFGLLRLSARAGEVWPTTAAKAEAIVVDGQIRRIVITDPGSGYCSSPDVKVEGFSEAEFKATLALGKDLKKKGAYRRGRDRAGQKAIVQPGPLREQCGARDSTDRADSKNASRAVINSLFPATGVHYIQGKRVCRPAAGMRVADDRARSTDETVWKADGGRRTFVFGSRRPDRRLSGAQRRRQDDHAQNADRHDRAERRHGHDLRARPAARAFGSETPGRLRARVGSGVRIAHRAGIFGDGRRLVRHSARWRPASASASSSRFSISASRR